ncbi:hypothetical protein STSO111631_23895 [Stackebrandtia soli]
MAVGLARLGVDCRFLGRFGADAFGPLSRARLADAGVRLDAAVDTDRLSTMAVVALSPQGTPEYSFYLEGTADWGWTLDELPPDDPDAIHVGSLAAAVDPARTVISRHVHRLAAAGTTTVSCDPNVRPKLGFDHRSETARIVDLAGASHLVKVSDEDLAWLYPGEPVAVVVARWRRDGVDAQIIVTLGAAGSVLYRPNGAVVRVEAKPVTVVDTIGAGDAFCSATLAALSDADALGTAPKARLAALSDGDWARILAAASRAAELTCSRPGADPPSWPEWEACR